MKYIIIHGDGMADWACDELGGKTPLQAAHKPNMDLLATRGTLGMVATIPKGMPSGSDVGTMTMLGYDPAKYHTGRAPIEVDYAEGESEVGAHEQVHATDGEVGRLKGFAVDSADHRVTYVLLREGHLWGHKDVAIPVSAVASLDDGVWLNITKKQVQELPPRA